MRKLFSWGMTHQIAAIFSIVASVITIGLFVFLVISVLRDSNNSAAAASPARSVSLAQTPLPELTSTTTTKSRTPTLAPSVTPTSSPSLVRDLEAARIIKNKRQRDQAYFNLTKNALVAGNYEMAIQAASESPSNLAQARSLILVINCAIDEELYDLADQAARKIKDDTNRDVRLSQVIKAGGSKPSKTEPSKNNRESMDCLN